MKIKHFVLIVALAIIIVVTAIIFVEQPKENSNNIKIPILLYHDFVKVVPDSDPDNFNYINTPESFEENIKTLLNNGYNFISFQELNDAINKKIELPKKPILINMDDGIL